jgi:hypothetical protein
MKRRLKKARNNVQFEWALICIFLSVVSAALFFMSSMQLSLKQCNTWQNLYLRV